MNYFLNICKCNTYRLFIEEIPRWANERYYQPFSFSFYSSNSGSHSSYKDGYPSLQADDKLELLFISCSSLRETYYKQDSCSYSEKHYPFEFTKKLLSNSNHYYK